MPMYEYQCKNCDHKLETLQKISEVDLLNCPKCNKHTLKKIISLSSFRIYGEGVHKPNKR